MAMKIKKGDTVRMQSGKDRGKTGTVLRISPKDRKLAVSGLNLVKRHMRPKQSGQKGQIVSIERLVSASAVALVNKETGKFVRVGWQHATSGGKIRIDRKTNLPL